MMLHTQDFAGSMWSAGCDWLSFTVPNQAPGLPELVELWKMQTTADAETHGGGGESAPQGYHGEKSRHWFHGSRQDGHFFQATSDAAREGCEIALQYRDVIKPTRIDLQATIQRERDVEGTYSEIRSALREREARSERIAKRALALYETAGSGDSVTIGARSSHRTFTVYNKSAEQKNRIAPRLMRFELRLRQQQARGAFRALCDNGNQSEVATGMCARMMERLELPQVPAFGAITQSLPTSYYQTDEERRFKWLTEQVAPVARRIEDPAKRAALKIAFGF